MSKQISISSVGNPVCPICHSDKVKGHKVYADGAWWSRCISGKDHGVCVLEDGTEVEWDKNLYFTDDGLCELIMPDGKVRHVRIARQEWK